MGAVSAGTLHLRTTCSEQSAGKGGEGPNLTNAKPVQHVNQGSKGDNRWWTPWLRK